jgi:uncharacterized protein YlxW (UPF0749 family)
MSAFAPRLRAIPSWQVTLGAALLVLGFLVATQFRAEEPRVRYTTQERGPLVGAVLELQADQEALKTRILDLNEAIATELSGGQGDADLIAGLTRQLDEARLAAGLVATEGPGVVVQLDDAGGAVIPGLGDADERVSGRDIRVILDQLWLSGAEAIAVNGERVVGPTAVLEIGGTILVNAAYLTPPYQVAAIGPDDLYARLAGQPGFAGFLADRSAGAGIRVAVAEPDRIVVPAYAGSLVLRYGRPEGGR